MTEIRLFEPPAAAYEALIDLQKTIWPDTHVTAEWLRHQDRNWDPQYYRSRWVIEREGQVIAYGYCSEMPWSYRPGKYTLTVWVRPNHERQGLGTAMYDHIMQALTERTPKPTLLMTSVRDTQPQSMRFLEKRGYQQVMRWISSELALKRFIPGKFMPILDKVRQQGINIVTVAQLRQFDPDWQQKLYDLDWKCSLDEPQPDAPTREPLDQFIKYAFEGPKFWPEAWFVALDGEQYVGLTQLFKNEDNTRKLDSGFTAVLRSHRRRGIAMALKVAALNFARRRKIKTITTGNEENNPMYQINLRLGFEPQWSELAFEKRLTVDGAA